MLMMAEQTDS